MANSMMPFNIELLTLSKSDIVNMKPITSLAIFVSSKEDFDPNGLFSTEIFGPVGSNLRKQRFAYIDTKLDLIHPAIYQMLTTSRSFYKDIMSGKEYAIFDEKQKDFIKSDIVNGKTGFHFFITHLPELKLADTNSAKRKQAITLLNTYRNKCMTSKILVIPAGYRDVSFEDDGHAIYDEINDIYKKLISLSNNIQEDIFKIEPTYFDTNAFQIQEVFLDLYMNILQRVSGKKKLFLGKWASRRIFNGTRNVITASDTASKYLGDKSSPNFNSTIIGMYQLMKAILPIAVNKIQNSILKDIFIDVNEHPLLINPETLELETVEVSPKVYDYFTSSEGIEKFINDFQDQEIRHKPIKVNDHYLALIYKDDNGHFKVFNDIHSLPTNLNKEDVSPITYSEFFYSVMYKDANKYPGIIVRYPIAETGSTVPTFPYMKTTVKAERRVELDDNWMPVRDEFSDDIIVATEFPIRGEKSIESMSPPLSSLGGLSADFDGDVCSFNALYSDESIAEISKFLQSRKAYVTSMGQFIKSVGYDTVNYVCYNLSGD